MRSKIQKWLLLIVGLLVSLNASAQYRPHGDFNVDGLAYIKNADGKSVTLTWDSYMGALGLPLSTYSGNIIIPDSVKYENITYSVSAIDNHAFIGSKIKSVVIGNRVRTIGVEAFKMAQCLGTVVIGDSVSSIKQDAFFCCDSLTTVVMGRNVELIGQGAFNRCFELTNIELPSSVISIGDAAFYKCTGLTSISIPNSVTSIGESAFLFCEGLTSIVVESGNPKYDSRDNCNAFIETATNTLISGCKTTVIPNSVTSIGWGAFYGCTGLTSITIPNSVTSIGESAFSSCEGLTSVTIPNSVTSIGGGAFSFCTALKKIVIPNTFNRIENEVFLHCWSLQDVSLGNKITSIGNSAFLGCTSLKSIIIPNSVTEIGQGAFSGCDVLRRLTVLNTNPPTLGAEAIPNGVKVGVPIGCLQAYQSSSWGGFNLEECFYNNKDKFMYALDQTAKAATVVGMNDISIKEIAIPEFMEYNGCTYHITAISKKAFYNCTGLTGVTIPKSVTSIGDSAFVASSLKTVQVQNSNPPTLGVDAFNNYTIAFVPKGSLSAYKNSNWRMYKLFEVGNYFADDTFMYEYNVLNKTAVVVALVNANLLTSVNVPETITCKGETYSVTSIGGQAFSGCTGLTSIDIPNSVTSIGEYVFAGCTDLTSITIPNSVTSIGDNTFSDCTGLTSIVIPNSVTEIGKGAFSFCSGLTSVTIPNSVTSIGESAFSRCEGLTSVTMPNSITAINSGVFYGCYALSNVTIPDSVTTIGEDAFYQCRLQSLTIPNLVTSIGKGAFAESRLQNVVIGSSVKTIGDYAFSYCGDIDVISLNPTPPECGIGCLNNYSNIVKLSVPSGFLENYKNKYPWSSVSNIQEIETTHFEENGIKYYYNVISKTAYAIGTTDLNVRKLIIPNTISIKGDTYPVTSISPNAFKDCRYLLSVSLGENVINVGEGAFAGRYIEEIYIQNLKNWCNIDHALSSLFLTVTGDLYLNGAIITDLVIPEEVTVINDKSFYNCQSIKSVSIPKTVSLIGKYSFEGCNICEVYISNMEAWCNTVFNDFVMRKPGTLYLNNQPIVNLFIPDGINAVKDNVFCNCACITSVSLPSSVNSIGNSSFQGCTGLKSFTIPSTVLSITGDVFEGCSSLTSIYSLGEIPPEWHYNSEPVYWNITLFVPMGAAKRYKIRGVWRCFKCITEIDFSSIDGIKVNDIKVSVNNGMIEIAGAENAQIEVFDLSGQCVYSGMETSIPVEKGIYIVRVAGTVHKVIL